MVLTSFLCVVTITPTSRGYFISALRALNRFGLFKPDNLAFERSVPARRGHCFRSSEMTLKTICCSPALSRSFSSAGKSDKFIHSIRVPKCALGINRDGTSDKPKSLSPDVTESMETVHGKKYIVDGELENPTGREAWVRSVWIIDTGTDFPRLVTAYPLGR
jgi:hypothetical protein